MKRVTLGVVGALTLFVAGAFAQDAIFAFRGAYQDTVVSQPCGANGLKGSATMTVYDRNAWIVYTCNDDRVVLRRYFNPNDNAVTAIPVYTTPAPVTPQPTDCAAYPGFVMGRRGGCVPPDHPDAR